MTNNLPKMLKKLPALLPLVMTLPALLGAPPFGDGFATGNLQDYLEGPISNQGKVSLQRLESRNGTLALSITDNTTVRFNPVAVSPNTKYTLRFKGSFVGGESIEENPRLDVALAPRGSLSHLPSHGIEFLDAESKPIQVRHPGGIFSGLPYREWHEYSDTFYSPPRAAFLRLNVRSAHGITFSIADLEIQKTPDEGAINVNPSFKEGFHNYSGWSALAAGAKMLLTQDGRSALDVQYGSTGSVFPISEPGTYQTFLKVTPNGYAATIELSLFDNEGKLLGSSFRVGDKTPFILPPGTAFGSFFARSVVLEELWLIRVGDESKAEELRKK